MMASILSCENTGAEGPFGYRERRHTNSSARIRNRNARSASERSIGGTGPFVCFMIDPTIIEYKTSE